MTDRTQYDRTEEEAPTVPMITTPGEQTPTPDQPNVRALRQKCAVLRTHLDQIEQILDGIDAEDR